MMETENTPQTITAWTKSSGCPDHPGKFEINYPLGFAWIDHEVISRMADNYLYLTILLKSTPKGDHKPH